MAPRTSWKGFLKLSLVSVPVKAFTASNSTEEIRLNQLHADCNSRVRYKKVCPEHGELKADEIVSGYEYSKDSYVVIDSDEISKLRTQSDKAVHIEGFVTPDSIDPVYLAGKTYYLMPDGVAGNRPYALLVQGMQENEVVAVAQVVLSGREQLVQLRPDDGLLVMSVLNYAKKVKSSAPFREELQEEAPSKEEMTLTHTLIGASRIEEFDLERYKDTYVENLSKLIQLKIDGQEVVQAPDQEEPKIINLMEALKKSVAEVGTRKMAPSVGGSGKKAGKGSSKKSSAKKEDRLTARGRAPAGVRRAHAGSLAARTVRLRRAPFRGQVGRHPRPELHRSRWTARTLAQSQRAPAALPRAGRAAEPAGGNAARRRAGGPQGRTP